LTTQSVDIALPFETLSRKRRLGRRGGASHMADAPPLRDVRLFAVVDDATLDRLALEAKIESFEDGGVIFRQGDPVTAFVVVVSGYVKLLRTAANGDETLIAIRADGESVGDAPSGSGETCGVSAEAVGPVAVLKLPAGRFARVMRESPALCAAMMQDAKERIASLTAEIESLKGQNADQRLARFILSLCPPGEERCRFRLPYDKRLIAERLGVKQETLSRAFAKLREIGVGAETREVRVESVTRLAEQCEDLGRSARLPSEREGRNASKRA
jgi:CRP-like cAMP-binding protein